MQLEFRLSDISELELGLDLLRKSALWLRTKNIDYWQNWINPQKIYVDWITQGFEANQFYFVQQDSKVIGIFRLQWEDEIFWGKQDENSGYIHSFTIDRDFYGLGIGKQVLSRIEELCLDNNKHFLRLDCGINTPKLCKYYEDYGFQAVGEVVVGNEQLRLYEKQIKY